MDDHAGVASVAKHSGKLWEKIGSVQPDEIQKSLEALDTILDEFDDNLEESGAEHVNANVAIEERSNSVRSTASDIQSNILRDYASAPAKRAPPSVPRRNPETRLSASSDSTHSQEAHDEYETTIRQAHDEYETTIRQAHEIPESGYNTPDPDISLDTYSSGGDSESRARTRQDYAKEAIMYQRAPPMLGVVNQQPPQPAHHAVPPPSGQNVNYPAKEIFAATISLSSQLNTNGMAPASAATLASDNLYEGTIMRNPSNGFSRPDELYGKTLPLPALMNDTHSMQSTSTSSMSSSTASSPLHHQHVLPMQMQRAGSPPPPPPPSAVLAVAQRDTRSNTPELPLPPPPIEFSDRGAAGLQTSPSKPPPPPTLPKVNKKPAATAAPVKATPTPAPHRPSNDGPTDELQANLQARLQKISMLEQQQQQQVQGQLQNQMQQLQAGSEQTTPDSEVSGSRGESGYGDELDRASSGSGDSSGHKPPRPPILPKPSTQAAYNVTSAMSVTSGTPSDLIDGAEHSDVTQLDGYQDISGSMPTWKRAMVEKKNKQLVEAATREVMAEQQEEEKWRGVPEWKKALMQEKAKKADADNNYEEIQRKREEDTMMASMPEWKRNLIRKKRGDL